MDTHTTKTPTELLDALVLIAPVSITGMGAYVEAILVDGPGGDTVVTGDTPSYAIRKLAEVMGIAVDAN